jgi:hypothetical protein
LADLFLLMFCKSFSLGKKFNGMEKKQSRNVEKAFIV